MSVVTMSEAASSEADLLPELVQAGWGKFWSRREDRYYYHNRLTNQSQWEPPTCGHDLLTDPLGISEADPKITSSENIPAGLANAETYVSTGVKRAFCEQEYCEPYLKKVHLSFKPFWNFEVPSNVMVKERSPLHLFPPHPQVETFRCALVTQLRSRYQELCQEKEGIDAPPDSFNRWLLERKVIDKGSDPILPSDCSPELSQSLVHEIISDIPLRLTRPKLSEDARKLLFKYSEAMDMLLASRAVTPQNRKKIKHNVNYTFRWLRSRHKISFEDYLERLTQMKRQCEPCIYETVEPSVESVVRNLYNLSVDACHKIHAQIKEVFLKAGTSTCKDKENSEVKPQSNCSRTNPIMCQPVQLSVAPASLPPVDRLVQNEVVYLTWASQTLSINQEHFWKLEELYGLNCLDDVRFDNFLARVWCLLKRYQTYFGVGPHEGQGNQGALCPALMESLHRVFDVTFECFASPFNCYFKQFCSAFPDTDGYFGSRGSFLSFCPTSGSFEANPPFSEELMLATVDHMESLLGESSDPLSFIVFIPDWRDPPIEALIRLESSRFKKKQFVCPPYEHEYQNGFQHLPSAKSEMSCKAVFGTLVVFLQNKAGYNKWTPTAEKIKELILATKS